MSKKKKKPVLSLLISAYFSLMAKSNVTLKPGLPHGKGCACKKYCRLTASFGWEGDKDAPIAFIDGSYYLRDNGNKFIFFGVKDIDGKIDWYNKEGYLPCFVSHFFKKNAEYTIESFADKVVVGENPFELVFSRMTVQNHGSEEIRLPKVSSYLVPLSEKKSGFVSPGETVSMDFVIGADRFGGKYPFPSDEELVSFGNYDSRYSHMKAYWEQRLAPLAKITECPEPVLIDAYKAGYIYTMIVKDGDELHVGENGYDRVFDHDVLGILAYLVALGDFTDFKKYAKYILQNVQYPDARWKYSWPFALYLQKTGDTGYIRTKFGEIKKNAHSVEESIEADGVMKRTNAIDSNGRWTIDNQSALTGLQCYAYICSRLGESEEEKWALNLYDRLLDAVNKKLCDTIKEYGIDYIPISLDEPNETGPRSDPRDANWASMFHFGRWSWDAFLFGGRQDGVMLNLIDKTYEHGFERRRKISDSIYNFGGYPHGYYCSAYNAGYGSAALRGDKYRDVGIKAYLHMINHAQSGPFSWWEGIDYPSDFSVWSIPHASGGGGSCQHIWGQSTATKVLFDSIISEKHDGTLIIGRGIPAEWLNEGKKTRVEDFPVSDGKKINVGILAQKDCVTVEIELDSESDAPEILAELNTEKEIKLIVNQNKSK